ncbi:hypothetical protein KVF89_21365 [Nocardioides carbamazepini]|uniref:hypothetical protein n=1 Tax=Nocardioides carbamazepini TaxID=2854259 RepID=UPI00214A5E61|nr:hypothetical protein [Nocardioides carbamazepini]MCR1785102.1 hypothetical protein [Nocardioides carbamazepini]
MFKKLIQKRLAGGPDMQALITAVLAEGETMVAWTVGAHCAGDGSDNSGIVDGTVVSDVALTGDLKLSTLTRKAMNARDRKLHTGGEQGSDARRIPINKMNPYHLLTDRRYVLLDFGFATFAEEPEIAFTVGRDRIASIARVGKESRDRVRTRITFVDDSFADYDLWVDPAGANAGFWS